MATRKHFNDLPDELLVKIFSHFSLKEVAMSVQHVSARWRDVSRDNSLWRDKMFNPGADMNDDEIARHLKNMPALKAFCPERGTNTNIINILCQACDDIVKLEFSWSQRISSSHMKNIYENFPNIVILSVPFSQQMQNQLEFAKVIGQFKHLVSLNCGRRNMNPCVEGTLIAIADGCPSLKNLDFGYCEFPEIEIRYLFQKRGPELLSLALRCYVSTLGHELLTECRNLQYLDYECYNNDLPRHYMDHLSKLSELKELTLSYFKENQSTNISNIFHRNSLSNLVKLSIHHCDGFGATELSGIFINRLQIEILDIKGYNDSAEGFRYISNLKQLQHLDISYSGHLSDECVEYIGAGCKNLVHLCIKCCSEVSNKSVEYVCVGCSKLKYLDISGCSLITDAAFESIIKCIHLADLYIKWNHVITGSHFHLLPFNLTQLKQLTITGCTKVDPENVLKLKEKLPDLKVVEDLKTNELDIKLEDSRFLFTDFV